MSSSSFKKCWWSLRIHIWKCWCSSTEHPQKERRKSIVSPISLSKERGQRCVNIEVENLDITLIEESLDSQNEIEICLILYMQSRSRLGSCLGAEAWWRLWDKAYVAAIRLPSTKRLGKWPCLKVSSEKHFYFMRCWLFSAVGRSDSESWSRFHPCLWIGQHHYLGISGSVSEEFEVIGILWSWIWSRAKEVSAKIPKDLRGECFSYREFPCPHIHVILWRLATSHTALNICLLVQVQADRVTISISKFDPNKRHHGR